MCKYLGKTDSLTVDCKVDCWKGVMCFFCGVVSVGEQGKYFGVLL